MSNDHTQVVDDFGSGFEGKEVLISAEALAAQDADDADDDLIAPATPAAEASPAAADVVEPPVMHTLTNEEYLDLVNGVKESRSFREDASRKLDTALGKIGGTERLIQQIQSATPKGEVPELTAADLGSMNENFPHITEDLLPALNKVLKNVKGTGSPVIVDPNVINPMVQESLKQALPAIRQQLKTELKRESELELTVEAHPDAMQIFADPEFMAWGDKQDDKVKAIVRDSWNSKEMIPTLTDYKKFKTPTPAPAPKTNDRSAALKAAVNPKGAGAIAPKALTDDDQFEAGFKEATADRT